jgi:hypothetical protein
METKVGGFIFGVTTTLCALLVILMLWHGPEILEWVEGTPTESEG